MFPEPPTPGPPSPDTPPDSSRISHGPGEQDRGEDGGGWGGEQRESPARIPRGRIRTGVLGQAGWKIWLGFRVVILD